VKEKKKKGFPHEKKRETCCLTVGTAAYGA